MQELNRLVYLKAEILKETCLDSDHSADGASAQEDEVPSEHSLATDQRLADALLSGFGAFVVRPQSVRGRLIHQTDDSGLTSTSEEKKAEAALQKPKPHISCEVGVSSLRLSLNKPQFESIFRMAEFVRQYQLKHDTFNRHRKYKYLRPLYPILAHKAKPELASSAAKDDDDAKQAQARKQADCDDDDAGDITFEEALAVLEGRSGAASRQFEIPS